ncbi:MAG: manganese efflux pump MntP family protein [Eubacteriales bacterium]|nr:manganese efflux pump MntP family protein [Eubacteriales bacterium]
MTIIELIILAIGLSMDAFAISICKGLSLNQKKYSIKYSLLCGLWFGIFQALMPFIGFFLGASFNTYINIFDHWVAFLLLFFIGMKMIKDALSKEEERVDSSFSFYNMFILAIATSIDALAIGISLAILPEINIYIAISIIGVVTFLFSFFGVFVGHKFGLKYNSIAQILGGIILIVIGIKVLIEHLFF